VAAGLVNPVTGKNFEPSHRIAGFLPEAVAFYQEIERELGRSFWFPLPILRLARDEGEWRRIERKLERDDVRPWLDQADSVAVPDGWFGAVQLIGGGRLDTRGFLDASREFFAGHGIYQNTQVPSDSGTASTVWCDGAAGLLSGRHGTHRCAKGEILTIEAGGWDETHILIGAGGWLVPVGGGRFKVGATYEWSELDSAPTQSGRETVEGIARCLGGGSDYTVIAHDAGVRPILRRSQPYLGPLAGGGWMLNGLGSKGTLYAPGMARRLARWLCDDIPCEAEFDCRNLPPCHESD
jgi:glycine/D-amino acid oxidase-like deaminating enzyme